MLKELIERVRTYPSIEDAIDTAYNRINTVPETANQLLELTELASGIPILNKLGYIQLETIDKRIENAKFYLVADNYYYI